MPRSAASRSNVSSRAGGRARPLWWGAAALGVLVLPWHMPDGPAGPGWLLAAATATADGASAAAQAVRFGRWWLLPPLVAVLALAPAALSPLPRRARGTWLLVGAGAGLAAIAAQGLAIGLRGW